MQLAGEMRERGVAVGSLLSWVLAEPGQSGPAPALHTLTASLDFDILSLAGTLNLQVGRVGADWARLLDRGPGLPTALVLAGAGGALLYLWQRSSSGKTPPGSPRPHRHWAGPTGWWDWLFEEELAAEQDWTGDCDLRSFYFGPDLSSPPGRAAGWSWSTASGLSHTSLAFQSGRQPVLELSGSARPLRTSTPAESAGPARYSSGRLALRPDLRLRGDGCDGSLAVLSRDPSLSSLAEWSCSLTSSMRDIVAGAHQVRRLIRAVSLDSEDSDLDLELGTGRVAEQETSPPSTAPSQGGSLVSSQSPNSGRSGSLPRDSSMPDFKLIQRKVCSNKRLWVLTGAVAGPGELSDMSDTEQSTEPSLEWDSPVWRGSPASSTQPASSDPWEWDSEGLSEAGEDMRGVPRPPPSGRSGRSSARDSLCSRPNSRLPSPASPPRPGRSVLTSSLCSDDSSGFQDGEGYSMGSSFCSVGGPAATPLSPVREVGEPGRSPAKRPRVEEVLSVMVEAGQVEQCRAGSHTEY